MCIPHIIHRRLESSLRLADCPKSFHLQQKFFSMCSPPTRPPNIYVCCVGARVSMCVSVRPSTPQFRGEKATLTAPSPLAPLTEQRSTYIVRAKRRYPYFLQPRTHTQTAKRERFAIRQKKEKLPIIAYSYLKEPQ